MTKAPDRSWLRALSWGASLAVLLVGACGREVPAQAPELTPTVIAQQPAQPSLPVTRVETTGETAPVQTPPASTATPTRRLEAQPKSAQPPPGTCCNHPYYHSVWRATSIDGKTWSKDGRMLIDHASVPHPIQLPDGRVVVYYVNGNTDTFDCSITDDGATYRYGDCKLFNYTTQRA